MELSVSRDSQRNRAIRWSLAALAAVVLAVGALAQFGSHVASGTHPNTRTAVQAPAVNEPTLSGECLEAQPLNGPIC